MGVRLQAFTNRIAEGAFDVTRSLGENVRSM